MLTMKRKSISLACLAVFVAFTLLNTSCARQTKSEDAALVINSYTITANEFNELFKEVNIEDTPKARQAFLNNLIARKLLLQEAEREGLDKQKDFLKAVENFWQQSLIKIMVDKKVKEISSTLQVSDKEVEDFYNGWKAQNPDDDTKLNDVRESIMQRLLREKQGNIVNSWIRGLRDKSNVNIEKKALGIE